jgi:bifunctional non-homologous end joining protein LigD
MRSKAGGRRLSFVEFQSPTLVEKAPEGREWIHEIKYDGYRTELILEDGEVRAHTRRGYDWTDRYGRIVEAASRLKANSAIIDGEAVVLGKTGLPDYQALERELGNRRSQRLTFYAFDLIYLNGRDLRRQPLIKRKAALQKLLAGAPEALLYAEHLEVEGRAVFEHACRMALEGIVSKRIDAPYSMVGELDRAIDLLEILFQEGDIDAKIWFKHDSYFDPIRGHPRYPQLLELAG